MLRWFIIVIGMFFISMSMIHAESTCFLNFVKNHYNFPSQHFNVTALYESDQALKGFDYNYQRNSLGRVLFGSSTRLQDIYLASYLSRQDLLKLQQGVFGHERSEQYLACLSNTKINFFPEETKRRFTVVFDCNKNLSRDYIWGVLMELSMLDIERRLNYFIDGGVVECSVNPQASEDSIKQFFHGNNIDFSDFFTRKILNSKGLSYLPVQKKILFDNLKFALYLRKHPRDFGLQFIHGMRVFLPCGRLDTQNVLWEIDTRLFKFAIEFFIHYLYCSPYYAFNPFFNLLIGISSHQIMRARIPLIKDEKSIIFRPAQFSEHTIKPFSHIDALPWRFGDHVFNVKASYAPTLQLDIGNIWENFLYKDILITAAFTIWYRDRTKLLRIYDYDNRADDSDYNLRSAQFAFSFRWMTSFTYEKGVKLNIGSYHILKGKNVLAENGIMCSVNIAL